MAHPLFTPEVRLLLQESDTAGMKMFCETLHPATVAESLVAEELSPEQVWKFLSATEIRTQAAIFEYFPIDWQVTMVEDTGRQHMARLIEQMSHDDRVDLLRRLQPRIAEALLRLVDEADRRDIATLGSYAENTAGALMTTDYAWLPAGITVSDALDRLRLQAPDKETIYYIYVVDDQRKALGVVSLRNLILAARQAIIRDIMERKMVSVRVSDDRVQVAQEMARYDLLAIPVLDAEGRLVGIVTHDDAIDVVVQEATEDVQRLGGVQPMAENYLETAFATVWRKRAVWLACLFIAELFTFTVLSYFETAIQSVVVLSLFIPLCLSTGGNSGSQAATLITRAMALGQVTVSDWRRVLRHELMMGVVLGLTLGVIGYVRAACTYPSVLSNTEHRSEAFQIRVPRTEIVPLQDNVLELPQGSKELITEFPRHVRIAPPPGESIDVKQNADHTIYSVPADSHLMYEAVNRWDLALVISQSVAMICLWGTLVGSMLPLIFRRLGFDPAFASSPFVATFVDVTGIVIYFTIAQMWIPGVHM
jgi:magnesium transporter